MWLGQMWPNTKTYKKYENKKYENIPKIREHTKTYQNVRKHTKTYETIPWTCEQIPEAFENIRYRAIACRGFCCWNVPWGDYYCVYPNLVIYLYTAILLHKSKPLAGIFWYFSVFCIVCIFCIFVYFLYCYVFFVCYGIVLYFAGIFGHLACMFLYFACICLNVNGFCIVHFL